MDENHPAGEFKVESGGWSTARRFFVVRERVREPKAAVRRRLRDVRAPFNLLSLYQHPVTPDQPYRQPVTLREVMAQPIGKDNLLSASGGGKAVQPPPFRRALRPEPTP